MMFLIDCVLKTSVIFASALMALRFLRSRSAAVRHWVLSAALVCAALTPALSCVLPSWSVSSIVGVRLPATSSLGQAADVRKSDFDNPTRPISFPDWLPGMIWLSGAGAGVLSLFVGVWRLMRITRAAQLLRHAHWLRVFGSISDRYGIRRPVRLLLSRNSSILVTCGVARPKVILPQGAEDWSEERAAIVLSHELAHIRRRDLIAQMIAQGLRIIYWFNPLVWVVSNRLRLESECACDDAVLAEGIPPHEYAGHLLDLARTLNQPRHAWSAALAIANPSTVERRFTAMLNPSLDRRPVSRTAMLAAAVVLLLITLPIAALNSQTQPQIQNGPASLLVEQQAAPAPAPSAPNVKTEPQRAEEPRRPAVQEPNPGAEVEREAQDAIRRALESAEETIRHLNLERQRGAEVEAVRRAMEEHRKALQAGELEKELSENFLRHQEQMKQAEAVLRALEQRNRDAEQQRRNALEEARRSLEARKGTPQGLLESKENQNALQEVREMQQELKRMMEELHRMLDSLRRGANEPQGAK